MSVDPYHAVQAEIQIGLATADTLLASFRRIRNIAYESDRSKDRESEELAYARSELKATLSSLGADLEDLEESVRVVESTGPRYFGLDDVEVQTRRQYVRNVRQNLESMRAEVAASEKRCPPGVAPSPRPKSNFDAAPSLEDQKTGNLDDQAAWSQMEQQMLMQEQDRTIETISGTISTLNEQAGLMGREIGDHVVMLEGLEHNVDNTGSKLQRSFRRLQRFARETEETKSGWCIAILIVILCVLLIMVILV